MNNEKPFLGLIQISNWSTFTIVIFLIVSISLLTFVWVKKYSWTTRISLGLILGLLGGIITLSFGIEQTWTWPTDAGDTSAYTEFTLWLSMLPAVFIAFMLFFSPFLFFSRISDILLNGNNKKLKKNNIINLTITIIGAIIAASILFLLSYYLPDMFKSSAPAGGDQFDNLVDSYPSLRAHTGFTDWLSLGDMDPYWSIVIIFAIFIISILFVIAIKILDYEGVSWAKQIKEFILGFQILLERIISFISKLMPYLLISIIPLMFLDSNDLINNILSNLIFILIIGSISFIVFSIMKWKNNIGNVEKKLLTNTVMIPMILISVIFSTLSDDLSNYSLAIMLIAIPIVVLNYWTYFAEMDKDEYGDKSEFEYSTILLLGTFNIIGRIFWYYIISYCIITLIITLEEYILSFISKSKKGVQNV